MVKALVTRKITVEVEVPEGVSEKDVRVYLEKTLRKLKAPQKWRDRRNQYTPKRLRSC